MRRIIKKLVHLINGNRKFYYDQLRKLAPEHTDSVILELGSGKQVNGEDSYSASHIFSDCQSFTMTDVNPEFGHQILDVTKLDESAKYDLILCLNVLEHVYEYDLAITNMHRALKPGGTLVVAVPFLFPLHDAPHDYWRFTEHALRKMLAEFSDVEVKANRTATAPFGYFVTARR